MNRWLALAAVLAAVVLPSPAFPQATVRPCVTTGPTVCTPVSASTPMPISGSITPSGTQDVNLTQILGAAPSATNPIWVSPATASTPWAVSQATAASLNATVVGTGTFVVQAAQSGTWTVQPGNTANTTAWLVTANPSAAAGSALTQAASSALAANLVVKGSAGNLYGFVVSATTTLSAAAWWVMVYDATAAPSDGAVTPAKCYAMPLGATGASFFWSTPARMSTGITIGVSTTGCFSKTASTQAFISADYQ